MRKFVTSSFAALTVAAILGGCGAASTRNLVKYENGETVPPLSQVPSDGTYGLYGTYDYNAVATYPLTKGDKIGFQKKDDGTVIAIAGSTEVPLQTKWARPTTGGKRR